MSIHVHVVRRFELNQTLKTLLSASLFCVMASLSTGLTAAELKVGYVQVDKILQEAPQTAESGKN